MERIRCRNFVQTELNTGTLLKLGGNFVLCKSLPFARSVGSVIDSGIGLSITIDYVRVFINKTLSIESAYQ